MDTDLKRYMVRHKQWVENESKVENTVVHFQIIPLKKENPKT